MLVAVKEPQLILYGYVIAIDKDPARKDEWWQVKMHLFSIPPRTVVWTLREPQFTGREIFTMQGVGHFMKALRLENENGAGPSGTKDAETAAEKKNAGGKTNPFRRVK